ncbi:hypothetical protein DV701_15985 [Ornithinimicrobium avium]|uniref:Uncharacterized protein n=1 Tax=Ornithinimicrobium avium TaxID=2283195 RepID=A0A345NQV1_9MICO|nr:hypothetical protein DV701_15985 [Ornithinimicrobium avium]
MRWRDRETDGTLAEAYAEAARRLASSFASQPYDDQILLPFLFVYRHAIELDLKHAIREAVALRRMAAHRELPSAVELETKLRRYGHRLLVLGDKLDEHLQALDLERTPAATRRVLRGLNDLDLNGTGFRYANAFEDGATHIDFPRLAALLDETHRMLAATDDMLDYAAEGYRIAMDEAAQYESELRAEFEAYESY